MAELPVTEQYVYSWGAARPGTGHTVYTPDRIELCVLAENPQHTVSVLSPSDTQGRREQQVAMLPRGLPPEQPYCAKAVLGLKVNVSKLI